jgi:hypothetical protein
MSEQYFVLIYCFYSVRGARGSVVVKALCYKPEGCGFETRYELMFSIYLILSAALGTGLHSASIRNYYKQRNVSGE